MSNRPLNELDTGTLAKLIASAVNYLSAIEEPDLSRADRDATISKMQRDLSPMVFSPSVEPRTEVVEELFSLREFEPLLNGAIARIFESDDELQSLDAAVVLIDILIQLKLSNTEAIAFTVLEWMETVAHDQNASRELGERLVTLASFGGGGQASLMMAIRIRDRLTLSPSAAAAALRMVASFQPSLLSMAMGQLQAALEGEGEDGDAIREELVRDILERSDPLTFLMAFIRLSPSEFPGLSRAAFGGESAPYKVGFVMRGGESAAIGISWDGGYILIEDLQTDRENNALWHRDLLAVCQKSLVLTVARDDRTDGEYDDPDSLVSHFAVMLSAGQQHEGTFPDERGFDYGRLQ